MNACIVTFAIALGWSATAGAAEIYIGLPEAGGNRIDICYQWGMQCNGEAADMWCKSQSYDRALEWEVDSDIGAAHPTLVIGTGQVCAEPHCDGYFSITCAREDDWTRSTGLGGLVVEVRRYSQRSPEGILVVAVSEQDPTQATAGVIDLNGKALLHAAPGPWRVYPLNFKNEQPIKPEPGNTINVPGGSEGGFLAIMAD